LPSSLTEVLPSTLVCSTSPPVSVCGTVATSLARGFSRQFRLNPCGLGSPPPLPIPPQTCASPDLPGEASYGLGGLAAPDLPPCVPPSLITVRRGTGLFTRCPSPAPCGCGLGPPHPQLISMAAEPSGMRWEGFAPSSRYSCQHSLSHALQVTFPFPFAAAWDAPLPSCCHDPQRRWWT
jgi:hypothetical protein